MSTSVIVGGAGAIIGGFIGGPQGAMWGWTLGSALGNAIDPPVIRGPSLGDMAQQTTQEGVPIPIVYGLSPPIAGNVMCTSPVRIVKKKSGGKGGPKVETETAFRTYAVQFCEGPIGGFLRVWRNNVKVYDALDSEFNTPRDVSIFGTLPTRNEKFLEKARFFLGNYDQDASEDLEAIFGAGTTPAHRGIAYMVIVDEDVTDMRGAIPQWTVQVSPIEHHYESPVLWPWNTGIVADPRHPLNEYSYTFSASAAEGGPNDGSTGGTSNCSAKGSSIFGLGSFDSLAVAISSLNAAWASVPGARTYAQLPFAYSSAADISLSDRFAAPPTVDVGTPGSAASQYQRWTWLHHAIEGLAPTLTCNGTTGASNTAINAAPTGTLIHVSGSTGAVWDNWPRSWVMRRNQSTIDGVYQIGVQPITGGWGPTCSTGASAAYGAAVVRAERLPGKPSSGARKVSGTFRVLRAFVNTSGSGTGNPQALPLGPCREASDPLYSNQAYWEDAYQRAVDDGDMSSGLVYGVDYPKQISAAYQVEGPPSAYIFPDITEATVAATVNIQLYLTATATATWSVTSGALPDGWSLNSATGVISGTATTEGTYNFTISALGKAAFKYVNAVRSYTVVAEQRPILKSFANDWDANGTTTRVVSIGAAPAAGDLIIVVLAFSSGTGAASVTPPAGGTLSGSYNPGAGGTSYVWRKVADGSEGTTLTFTGTNSNHGLLTHTFQIQAGSYDASRFAIANAGNNVGSAINPPNVTPAWGSAANLWIVTCAWNNANAVTGFPAPDNQSQHNNAAGANLIRQASCTRSLEAASFDPSNFTGNGNSSWRSQTIAIGPP